MLAPTPDTSSPLVPSTGKPEHLGQPIVGQTKTANFATVFAAAMPRIQNTAFDDISDQPQGDVGAPNEGSDPTTKKQAEINAPAEKDTSLLTEPETTSDENPPTESSTKQDPQTKNEHAKSSESPVLAETTKGSPSPTKKPESDPWQTAVLPTGAVLTGAANLSKSQLESPTPPQLETEDFGPHLRENAPAQGSILPNASAPPANLNVPFGTGLVAEIAQTNPAQDTKLTARFAEPSAAPSLQGVPTSIQPELIAPKAHRAAEASTGSPAALVQTSAGGMPTANPAPAVDNTTGLPPNHAAPMPKPTGPDPSLLATSASLKAKPVLENPLHARDQKGALLQPIADKKAGTAHIVKSTESVVLSQVSQNGQTDLGNKLPLPKSPINPTAFDAPKGAAPEPDWHIPERSEPVLRHLSPSSIETSKLAAPLVPWQAVAPAFFEPTNTKDSVAIDPFSAEPRLSAASATGTIHGAIPRADLPPQIARQLAEAIQQNPNRPVEIILKPQELGAVRLSVQQAETGIIVNLTAERPETLDLMRRHIDQLEQDFQAMGYADIAFSFAGSDAGTDAQSDAPPSSGTAEAEDVTATPATHIHLSNDTTSGVDLRL